MKNSPSFCYFFLNKFIIFNADIAQAKTNDQRFSYKIYYITFFPPITKLKTDNFARVGPGVECRGVRQISGTHE